MIKNVIFDIGNVIFYYNREYLLSHFYSGKDFDFLIDKLFCRWEQLDEDKLSLTEYVRLAEQSLPNDLKKYASAVLNNWEYFMQHNKDIMCLIRELKQKGFKLYILSNMTKHFINNQYKFPILKEFDGIVYSAPIKMVKPNKEIYQYLLEKFNLNPTECVFIDDIKKNLATAARFGIKTFHYQSNTQELREFILSL